MAGSNTMTAGAGTEIVLVGTDNGVVVLTTDTPLRRLNYFDGKFLRAEDMQVEQDYLRTLVQLSNRAGGSGVVNGYDTVLAPGGAAVTVGQGLAIDPIGRVLLMPIAKTMALDDLIAATANAQKTLAASAVGSSDFGDCVVITPPTATTSGQSGDLYLLTVGFLEALCGEEDVFGQVCDNACVQSKDRRWRMEGVLFRAVPLTLKSTLEVSKGVPVDANQLRNRVASAYFEDERLSIASLINGTSIKNSATWCLGAQAELGDPVPLAVFSRSGGITKFLDAWTARRERMETPPRRYWAFRLAMRPWGVFLAQVLQFQCQLHDLFAGLVDGGTGGDPCAPKTAAIGQAAQLLAQLETWHAKLASTLTAAQMTTLSIQPFQIGQIVGVKNALAGATGPTGLQGTQILIDGGIVELPSAGYLPVTVGGPTVNVQVRNLLGPGVDLRFCLCRPDYIPHVLEEAQHMERISLLTGIDDPTAMPHVDVFVPDGQAGKRMDASSLYLDAARPSATFQPRSGATSSGLLRTLLTAPRRGSEVGLLASRLPSVEGAARWAPYGDAGQQFYWAGALRPSAQSAKVDPTADWFEATLDRDPLALTGPSQVATIFARAVTSEPQAQPPDLVDVETINLRFTPSGPATPGSQPGEIVIEGTVAGGIVSIARPPATGSAGGPISAAIRLRRLVTATGGMVTIEPLSFSRKQSGYFYWQWTTGSALAGSLHSVSTDDTGKVLGDVTVFTVKQDNDAQNPSNPFHGLSEISIPWLQSQLATAPFSDAGFGTYAEQALFPSPDPKSSFDVIAALDWVLFARRRETSCDQETFTKVAADEKFQVYWVDPENPDLNVSLAELATLLASNNANDMRRVKLFLEPVGVVSYPATGSALRDAATAVADAKAKLGEWTVLRGGFIGQQPPQDPDSLEVARLQSDSTALQSFMTLDPLADFSSLSIMPPALADPSVAGAIVIAASKPVETEMLVLRVAPERAGAFHDTLIGVGTGAENISRLVQATAAAGPLSVFVGVARFKSGDSTLQPDSNDLPTGWASAGGGAALEAVALLDSTGGDSSDLVSKRTVSIDGTLGFTPTKSQTIPLKTWDLATVNPAFAKAGSALFLVAGTAFSKVTVYNADVVPGQSDPIAALKIGGLSIIAQNPALYRPVGTFAFDLATGQVADSAALVKAWGSSEPPPQFGRVFFQGTPADATTVASRSKALMGALSLGGTAGTTSAPEVDNDAVDAGPFKGAPMTMVIGFSVPGVKRRHGRAG